MLDRSCGPTHRRATRGGGRRRDSPPFAPPGLLSSHFGRKEALMSIASLKTVRAVCPHDCPDTCSMVVTVRDGRAVDLRGDRDYAFTRGFLCQKVARYL